MKHLIIALITVVLWSTAEWNKDWVNYREREFNRKEAYREGIMSKYEREQYRAWLRWSRSKKTYNDWRIYKRARERAAVYRRVEHQRPIVKSRYDAIFNFGK